MTKTKSAFESYLSGLGRLEAVRLGDTSRSKRAAPTDQDSKLLRTLLESATKSTNWMLGLAMTMLVVVFSIGVFLVLQLANSLGALAAAGGGTLLFLLLIVERLRRIWVEKAILDIAWAGLNEWDPQDVLALVQLLYWHSIQRRSDKVSPSTK